MDGPILPPTILFVKTVTLVWTKKVVGGAVLASPNSWTRRLGRWLTETSALTGVLYAVATIGWVWTSVVSPKLSRPAFSS
ncbi:hypothetical protein SAMN05660733_01395 [Lentzea albidocapillata]|uniref:Uncharacterized protein n=1 Tax=Lentzea albidocapillata TaxID=40571 RepID=A0A1W2BCY8_9PSEU|nr:hypothetical protein SAMN05660733_01395 [Lentzea albidocapillata]